MISISRSNSELLYGCFGPTTSIRKPTCFTSTLSTIGFLRVTTHGRVQCIEKFLTLTRDMVLQLRQPSFHAVIRPSCFTPLAYGTISNVFFWGKVPAVIDMPWRNGSRKTDAILGGESHPYTSRFAGSKYHPRERATWEFLKKEETCRRRLSFRGV